MAMRCAAAYHAAAPRQVAP